MQPLFYGCTDASQMQPLFYGCRRKHLQPCMMLLASAWVYTCVKLYWPVLQGLQPETRTFNTIIIACNMCGQPTEALKVQFVTPVCIQHQHGCQVEHQQTMVAHESLILVANEEDHHVASCTIMWHILCMSAPVLVLCGSDLQRSSCELELKCYWYCRCLHA